ncbi:MAG: hydroxymyristoyl-ACP dehydratase [Desulfobacterales bacterium SG8_35]|nr:MAG: hydroxymyristoyl-ACP dehydratase [Desulfobacterales bacterium SG8_35]
MAFNPDIYQAIPHRPPFLWVDSIISFDAKTIVTEKFIAPDLDIFSGHYPGYPIMPGVLLCEAVFQTGALFMARMLEESGQVKKKGGKAPVLTRIKGAKFKRIVNPGDTIRMHVSLDENIGNAWFFKGKVLVDNKTAVTVDFGCTITDRT